jgi:cell fate regulator YaaT (PSP1 superfamily)
MEAQEYLVSYGLTGEFGRFRSAAPLALRRGERVVVRGSRGVEIACVLREATPRHAHFLPNTSVGQLLRRITPRDEQAESAMHVKGQQLFERGRQLATELDLPLELLDVEVLLDGEHAVLHHLRGADADVRPFVSTLSREFALHIVLVDLTRPQEAVEHEEEGDEHAGCGRPNCGREVGGGCSTCGSGGGCGTCGSAKPSDMELYFAQLREQMERRRTALL